MELNRMNRRAILQSIREERAISEEQKISLTRLLDKRSNHFDSLCRQIKSLTLFASGTYHELLGFERMECVKTLIRGIEAKISNDTFVKLMEILFGKVSNFSRAILIGLKKENEKDIKALMVQLLLHFHNSPVEGSSLSDYLSGLHHRDELFRCKILHFLHKHYGGEALSAILQEAIKIIPPPSLFFSMTLNHYLRLHPEIMWDEEIRRTALSRNHFSGNQMEKDRILIFFQQVRYPILRHEFLSLIQTCEQSIPHITLESGGGRARLRLDRLEKIESFVRKELPLFGKEG